MERDKYKDAEEVLLQEALSGAKEVQPVAESVDGAKKIAPLKPTPSPMTPTNQPDPKPPKK